MPTAVRPLLINLIPSALPAMVSVEWEASNVPKGLRGSRIVV